MNLNINTSTIIRGKSSNREKSVAFEFFIESNDACYKEAYKVLKSDQAGSKVRLELLTISRALNKCSTENILENTNINVFIEEAETIELLRNKTSEQLNLLPLNDKRYLSKINNLSRTLLDNGCVINYKQANYKTSTSSLANNILDTEQAVIMEDNLQETINALKPKLASLEDVSTCSKIEAPLASFEVNSPLESINNMLKDIHQRTSIADCEIEQLNKRIKLLKIYETSLSGLNLNITRENSNLENDLINLNKDIEVLDKELALTIDKINENEKILSELNNKMVNLGKEVTRKINSDKATIAYLQKQIEGLILKENALSVVL